jgi:hypothetical protein
MSLIPNPFKDDFVRLLLEGGSHPLRLKLLSALLNNLNLIQLGSRVLVQMNVLTYEARQTICRIVTGEEIKLATLIPREKVQTLFRGRASIEKAESYDYFVKVLAVNFANNHKSELNLELNQLMPAQSMTFGALQSSVQQHLLRKQKSERPRQYRAVIARSFMVRVDLT